MRETPAGEEKILPDRGRRSAGRRAVGAGLLLSIAGHVLLLVAVAFPDPRSTGAESDWSFREVRLPPRVEVPAPPEAVDRPPPPSVPRVDVTEPVLAAEGPEPPAAARTPPEPPRVRPAPPSAHREGVPRDVPPLLEASGRFRRRLRRSYRRMLRGLDGFEAAGVVRVRFFVDPGGEVSRVRVARSSGHGRLDRLARELVQETRFRPALTRDRKVGVWVSQPICFVPVEHGDDGAAEATCERTLARDGG